MYNLAAFDEDGEPLVEETVRQIIEHYPRIDLGSQRLRHLVSITFGVAKLILEPRDGKKMPQHLWLFELAGRLKGGVPEGLRSEGEIGERLSPLALVLVDLLDGRKAIPISKSRRIEWSDPEAVMLEFEEIWYKRKFAKGSPYVDEAVDFAAGNPLGLEGNPHYIKLLNVAYYLQTKQPGLPILLPISAPLASKLGTTPVTLGTAIAKAIREGILEVVDATFDIKSGKARSFRMNMTHPLLKARIPKNSQ